MKKMDGQNVKGTQDYLPNEEVIRRTIRRTLEDVFIQYGCKPIETPILHYTSLLASKYGGGAEILEEMYTLTDRGKRELALRYDLTMPFAKVVAMNPSLTRPFKRYEIGKVFRDGPIKTGRFREFTQCDVDIVGVDSKIAEAELMAMALDTFKKLGLDVIIQYNNRKLLAGMLRVFGVERENMNQVILIVDKREKVGLEAVVSELTEYGLSDSTITLLEKFLSETRTFNLGYFESFALENKEIEEGLQELKEVEAYLSVLGVQEQCVFHPFLARGLEIYTGTIYEIFLKDQSIQSSIGGGGRYDQAIGGLIGTDEPYSTVGISFGLDVIYTALRSGDKSLDLESDIDYYIVPLGTLKESLLVAKVLREKGWKVELEMSNKKVSKALKKANKENIPHVILIGEEEVRNNKIKVKEMTSGRETLEDFPFNHSCTSR